jgi:bacterioferritin (cytochrome b1)
MDISSEKFITNENIKNFRKRLEAPTDEVQRAILLRLLAQEEAKAEQLAKQAHSKNEASPLDHIMMGRRAAT